MRLFRNAFRFSMVVFLMVLAISCGGGGGGGEGSSATYYADADGDGYGDVNNSQVLDALQPGWVLDSTDCDDTPVSGASINPGAGEVCDGEDNDCDPLTDDGVDAAWIGSACDGPDSDLCEEGTYSCSGGTQVCSDATGDFLELCNGVDDDCNTATLDGADEPTLNDPCDGGDSDLCNEGTLYCDGVSMACSDTTGDSIEVCNDFDDDCDGIVDELPCTDCDDNLSCTNDSYQVTTMQCVNTLMPGFCLIDGTCWANGAVNPSNPCQKCDPGASAITWTAVVSGTPCESDGVACTSGECDGAGACQETEDDTYCGSLQAGDLCRPDCFSDASGCGTPPASLDLTCGSPVLAAGSSTCAVDLVSLTGQSACIDCSAEIGPVTVAAADFDDGAGACSLDGWQLVTGSNCSAGISFCAESGSGATCASSLVCPISTGPLAGTLAMEAEDNGAEQWRLTRNFDMTGLSDIRVSFKAAQHLAGSDEGLMLYASDGVNSGLLFCQNGVLADLADDFFYYHAVDLPAWADDNPDLTLTFVLHSETVGDLVFLDDIVVSAWSAGCPASNSYVFSETFNTCSLATWTVTGTPVCPGSTSCNPTSNIEVNNGQVSLEQFVDAGALDGDVTLCFLIGDSSAGAGESVLAAYNAGSTWHTAWYLEGNVGADGTCQPVCVNLSEIDPDVNNNPALGLRFTLASDAATDKLFLDEITINGSIYCDGSSDITFGGITDLGDGTYDFGVTENFGNRTRTDVTCGWDTPPLPLEDAAVIEFIP